MASKEAIKQFLLFNSCDPKHTTANVPYNLARKICIIVSDENQKEKRLEELKSFLKCRLHLTSLIEAGIKKPKKWTDKHQPGAVFSKDV